MEKLACRRAKYMRSNVNAITTCWDGNRGDLPEYSRPDYPSQSPHSEACIIALRDYPTIRSIDWPFNFHLFGGLW